MNSPGRAGLPSSAMSPFTLLPLMGRLRIAPAARTPGNAETRRTNSAKNSAASFSERDTESTTAPFGWKPGSTALSRSKLRKRSPAPASSVVASATSTTTRTARNLA